MVDGYIFYHATLRKTVIAFGTLFNNIHLQRKDADGSVVQTLKVPLSYGPKQKYLARIRQNPNLNSSSKIEISVPRLAFEITSFSYDSQSRVAATTKSKHLVDSITVNSQFSPSPWKVGFNLYILTKNQDDGLQILEQIIPFFTPEYTLAVKDIPDMGQVHMLPVTLQSIAQEDEYEGDFEIRTSVVWTLSFSTNVNFYGPVYSSGAIKHAIATVYPNMPGMGSTGERYTADVDPEEALPTDDYEILESWELVEEE